MIRIFGVSAVLVGVIALLVACSSDPAAAPTCQIEGSYSATGTTIPGGTCPDAPATPVVDTITARPPGATGPDFKLEITGLKGACSLNLVAGSACKVQGKCDVEISDALDPQNATGTVQYSWTFDSKGFTGTSTLTAPPGKSLPKGCIGQANVVGTRQ
jgi:hypothetical protein